MIETTERPSFICPRCQRTSTDPVDVRERYCGACPTGPASSLENSC